MLTHYLQFYVFLQLYANDEATIPGVDISAEMDYA